MRQKTVQPFIECVTLGKPHHLPPTHLENPIVKHSLQRVVVKVNKVMVRFKVPYTAVNCVNTATTGC